MLLKQLKQNFLIINATVYFDEQQYLREQTNNPARVQAFIQQAEVLLQQIDNEEEQYYLLGSLGYCYRILNQANKAIFYLEQCLKKVEANPARNMVTLIRLGEAYKYNNQHKKALKLFEDAQAIQRAHNIENYEDFIYQHKAKCLMELGDNAQAKELLKLALAIRKDKGIDSLITSTEKVLQLLKEE
ncbi:tetratricopeptide repeat protein [Metasolibacillus sp. FSL H7-0170]|uniref:tetratricopeptide repeat protein n=1 Tax=Metasolibacillus sp. FSL H7-0170 TaxID=2921431 RepID=UPI00315832D8